MILKIYDKLLLVNTVFLVLAAILTVIGNPIGAMVFVYTQIIGLVDALRNKSTNAMIICSTFLAMNIYFVFRG